MRFLTAGDFDEWRAQARELLAGGLAPGTVAWADATESQGLLPLTGATPAAPSTGAFRIPAAFLGLAREVACHREAIRFELLYSVLWRLTRGAERHLLDIPTDPEVHRLNMLRAAVGHDIHRMHAFVRFQRAGGCEGAEEYVAWYRPDHRIVHRAAPFFANRFGDMCWTILTPDECARWDTRELSFGPGLPEHAWSGSPGEDITGLWQAYYSATCNPQRINVPLLRRELPERFWRHLPEAAMIDEILRDAPRQIARLEQAMAQPTTTAAAASSKRTTGACGS